MRDNLKGTLSGQLVRGYSAYTIAVMNGFQGTEKEWLESLKGGSTSPRITSLDDTKIAVSGAFVMAVGIPTYVNDVSVYPEYGLTETGWYLFCRITSGNSNVKSSAETTVDGAAGCIISDGHIDVAIRFEVAAMSQLVTVHWNAEEQETFVFLATDLATRNLDNRVTFYVYDSNPFATWHYKRSADAVFVGTKYYVVKDGVYSQAAVKAHDYVPADTYYTHSYVISNDEVFQEGVVYYTHEGGVYTPAEVVPGEPLAPEGVDPVPVYYVDEWTLTTDTRFVGTRYYEENDGVYEQVAVKAGEPCSYYTKVITYPLPGTTGFVGTEYYTESDGEYTKAAVMAGTEIPENTYYTHSYVLTTDTKFQDGTTYYTVSGGIYIPATVTVGGSVSKNKYYVDLWTLAEGEFAGTAYYVERNGNFAQVPVVAGESIPAAYYTQVIGYGVTGDETFIAGKTYYTRSGSVFVEAEVTAGEDVAANTYYEAVISYHKETGTFVEGVTYYTAPAGVFTATEVAAGEEIQDVEYHVQLISWPQATDEKFEAGEVYYTLEGGVYTEAAVVAGAGIPAKMVHEKVTIEGLVCNVTYRIDDIVDCPMEFILPEVEDDTHGCWFEIRCRHAGAYSMTLVPPDNVKIATEHTQKEEAGINMINLHYTVVDGIKIWRFMNTHSSIPA